MKEEQLTGPSHEVEVENLLDRIAELYEKLRRANEETAREKEFGERLIDTAHVIVIVLDREGQIVRFNLFLAELAGYSLEETAGRDWITTFFSKPDREKVRIDFRNAMSDAAPDTCINPILTRDGGLVDIEWRFCELKETDGAPFEVLAVGRNVTRRLQREKDLAEVSERAAQRASETDALLESSRAVLELKDFEQAARSIFDSCKKLIGATAGYVALLTEDGMENEVLFLDSGGKSCTVDPDLPMPIRGLREIAYRNLRPAYDNDFSASSWMKYMPEGHAALDNVLFAPLVIDGRAIGLLGLANKPVGFDNNDARMAAAFAELAAISLRNSRTLKLLEKNEQRLLSIVETASDAIITTDSAGRIILWNRTAETIFGYRADEVIDKPLTILVPERFREAHTKAFERVASTGESTVLGRALEMTALKKNGDECPVELSVAQWNTKDNLYFTGILRDITDRKRTEENQKKLEEKVHHTQKLESLGILAGGIAHDFNNLLMGILGNVDLAMDDLPTISKARQNLKGIETAGKRAAELCAQMLAYSGKGRFVVESLDLNSVVEEMSHLLKVSISKKAVLNYNLGSKLPAIEADGTQIRQVIMNLITNASDAIGEKSGLIGIATGATRCDRESLDLYSPIEKLPEGVYVYVEIADTGCGMDKKTREKIFDPFYTTKQQGRGLGLAAVIGIVRGHKGAISIYSEPGRGTTFKVLFPAVDQPARPRRDSMGSENSWTGSGTVLLVDDDETVRVMGQQLLEQIGFKVLTAGNGIEALDLLEARGEEIICIVLDLNMPKMGGEETLRNLARRKRKIPVILTSGYNEQDVSSRFVGKKLAGFLQKPYRLAKLKDKLREILNPPGE